MIDIAGMVSYNFAVLRVVPHVFMGAFVNVGVILHAPTERFIGIRVERDEGVLRQRVADVDVDLLAKYLQSCEAVCRGDATAGPVALMSASERFHWLTAPRSDVLQCSPIHAGIARDVNAALDDLYTQLVAPPPRR